jgi:N-acetyl-gamma-glutamyl-phosphate reductase
MKKIKVGIIGGAGYTGGELLRILIFHPQVDISFVQSSSNAGNAIADVHTDLLGDTDLTFSLEATQDIDVLFLCVGHGDAKKYLDKNIVAEHTCIIDLSQDFRLRDNNGNLATHNTREFVYGLPEMQRKEIKKAKNIANPGCFATCLQLALLPLARKQLIHSAIHISATTGSTGAGQSLSATSHFSWRNNNLSVYKAFEHQHLNEIGQNLRGLQHNGIEEINFIPYRGDFTRGIMASVYLDFDGTLEEAKTLYKDFYKDAPFTHISDKNIHLKQVINTNKCILHLEKHGNKLMVISVIDNLLKGASGQAVRI